MTVLPHPVWRTTAVIEPCLPAVFVFGSTVDTLSPRREAQLSVRFNSSKLKPCQEKPPLMIEKKTITIKLPIVISLPSKSTKTDLAVLLLFASASNGPVHHHSKQQYIG